MSSRKEEERRVGGVIVPINYCIDSNLFAVFTHASGVLTESELIEHKEKLAQDPEFEPGMVELSDVRAVERVELTPRGLEELVRLDTLHTEPTADYRLAIVASDDLIAGLARLYESRTEPENRLNVGVFHNVDEARDWLGLPTGY